MRRGRVVGRKGFIVDKVEDLTPGGLDRPHPRGALRRRAARSACPSRCSCPSSRRTSRTYEEWLTHLRGSRVQIRVPERGDKRALQRDGHPQRRGGVHPSPPAPGVGPQQPQPGTDRAAGSARSARGAVAHRVLRHGPPPGKRLRRVDGRVRGRPPQQARVPPVQGQERAGQRRLRGDAGGADPPPDGLPRRPRRSTDDLDDSGAATAPTGSRRRARPRSAGRLAHKARQRGRFSYPPQLLRGRRRQGPARRRRRRRARPRARGRDPAGLAGQAVRGGVRAGAGGAGRGAAWQRRLVPVATTARRGPPLRQHASTASCAASG